MHKWYEELWNDSRIVGGNKLRTYQTLKLNFGWEDYLSVLIQNYGIENKLPKLKN